MVLRVLLERLDARQRLRRRIFASRCHDEHTRKSVRRVRVYAPVQDPLAIRVERLELVFREIHHTEFGELLGLDQRIGQRERGNVVPVRRWSFSPISCTWA